MSLFSSSITRFLLLTLIVLSGCVNLENMTMEERSAYLEAKEVQRHEREDGLITAREAFHVTTANCKEAGGMMIIERRFRNFSKSDYKNAYCINPGSILK